jgi:hypothetical protein
MKISSTYLPPKHQLTKSKNQPNSKYQPFFLYFLYALIHDLEGQNGMSHPLAAPYQLVELVG